MLKMISFVAAFGIVPLFGHAATIVSIRPGVMCLSAAALAQLTRPDGSSRSDNGDPHYSTVKSLGGCIDIRLGTKVAVSVRQKNTSIITYDTRDGPGAQAFIVPNIDFSSAGPVSTTPQVEAVSLAQSIPQKSAAMPIAAGSQIVSVHPSVMEIAGLMIGMSEDQARSKLAAGLTVKENGLNNDPSLRAIVAYSTQGQLSYGQEDYEAYGLGFVDGKLAYVDHIQKFSSSKEPSVSDVASALTKKYGHKTGGIDSIPSGGWAQSMAGQPLPNGDYNLCNGQMKVPVMLNMSVAKPGQIYDQLNIPIQSSSFPSSNLPEVCGQGLFVSVTTDPNNSSLIAQLEVWMEDYQPYFTHDAKQKAEAVKKTNEQINLAHQNKPNL